MRSLGDREAACGRGSGETAGRSRLAEPKVNARGKCSGRSRCWGGVMTAPEGVVTPSRVHKTTPRIHGLAPRVHKMPSRVHGTAPGVHKMPSRVHGMAPRVHKMPPRVHETAPRVHKMPSRVHKTASCGRAARTCGPKLGIFGRLVFGFVSILGGSGVERSRSCSRSRGDCAGNGGERAAMRRESSKFKWGKVQIGGGRGGRGAGGRGPLWVEESPPPPRGLGTSPVWKRGRCLRIWCFAGLPFAPLPLWTPRPLRLGDSAPPPLGNGGGAFGFGALPLCPLPFGTLPLRHSATASLVHPRPPLVAVLHSAP